MRLIKLFGLCAAVVMLVGAVAQEGPVGLAQADCTVTVQPGQSIQKAIDGASEGAVICLATGTWQENIEIKKSLTLRGAGWEQTKLGKASISIYGPLQTAVFLERLTVTGGEWQNISIFAAKVIISESQISSSDGVGIFIVGADVTIAHSRLLDNKGYGIYMQEPGQLAITSSLISDNGSGVFILNIGGLGGYPAGATIIDSQISSNKASGITLAGVEEAEAQVEIKHSLIQNNGTSEDCKKKSLVCNGITVYWVSYVKLTNSKVINNADWGVGASLKQCGYSEDVFFGQAVFEGMTIEDISGNNVSGNQNGLGNPGNHPWNHPGVPDGQVCLP